MTTYSEAAKAEHLAHFSLSRLRDARSSVESSIRQMADGGTSLAFTTLAAQAYAAAALNEEIRLAGLVLDAAEAASKTAWEAECRP